MFVLINPKRSFKMGHLGSKTRSLGQILVNLLYALETTFSVQYPWNMVRNVCFDDFLDNFEMVHVK